MPVETKVIFGKLSAAKKSGDFRCPSRRSLPVLMLATSTDRFAAPACPDAGSSWKVPEKPPKRPITVLTPR